MSERAIKAVIVGAGPAGLTAAYELSKKGQRVVVLESDPKYVGGISRTVEYHGYRFDIGGHRFFSKSREVEDLWTEILGADMLERPRSSKIYYGGNFYAYPLKPLEAFSQLGMVESARCVLSFLKARLKPVPTPNSFEDWVVNEFGERLFRIFFKTYTDKVWGMSCKDISADWAAQRIKGLTLGGAIKNALLPNRRSKDRAQVVKTLIDTFRYPRFGPGMMWEACAEKVRGLGGEVLLGRSVEACRFDAVNSSWIVAARTADGALEEFHGEHLISSMPMRQLVGQIEPRLPESALRSANSLRYRDFLTIGLILRERNRFNDNWIYIHDPNVKVGRVQNYKSWSPEMVPDPDYCCYGLEYFCFEGDGLWTMTAVYDDGYQQHLSIIRSALEAHCRNLHLAGRNGMHKYNNQDHAMITALLAARNILAGENKFDAWSVNEDGEYHEAGQAGQLSAESGVPPHNHR